MERSRSPRVAQVVEHDLARFDSDDDPLTRLTPVDSVQSHVGQDLSGHPSVELHGRLLRRVSCKRHYQSLGVAARDLLRSNVLPGKVATTPRHGFSVCRHITKAHAKSLYDEVDAYCSKHDPPLPAATCAATATPTTDTSHRATSMTTSIADFLEPPCQ